MQIHITGRNIEITEAIRNFTAEKMERLEERFKKIDKMNVTLHVENVTHHAEASTHFYGVDIHASAKAGDMYSAIDALVDKLHGQISKQKDKITDHR